MSKLSYNVVVGRDPEQFANLVRAVLDAGGHTVGGIAVSEGQVRFAQAVMIPDDEVEEEASEGDTGNEDQELPS